MSEASERKSKPPVHRDDAIAVLKRLRENGHVAYFAGGCVRDMLLGLTPSDFDVATDAPPDRVRGLFSQSQAVGAKFGVILVRHRQSTVEVATFRSEGAYLDGRRPSEVRFTTAEEDAQRRDFTINGMFFDPIADQVVDFVGGQADLKARVLRAIGDPDERFREDHLRLLRAVRFAARFNLSIDPATAQGIARHATHLKAISPERIAEELRLMLTPPIVRDRAWERLWKFQLIQVIFRTLPERPIVVWRGHGDFPLFPMVGPNQPIDFGLALAALTLCYRMQESTVDRLLHHSEIMRSTRACRTTLRISNEEANAMEGAMDVGHLLRDDPPGVAAMKRFLARSTSPDARILMNAMNRASLHSSRIQWLEMQFDRLLAGDVAPIPLLTGDDLVAMGMSPGPAFKNILNQVYDAQLENRVNSRDEAMAMVRSLSNSSPSTR